MRPVHAVCALAVALSFSGCDDPEGTREAAYDLQFLDTMSKHHADAIEMARLSHGKIQRPELQELVRRIPIDQQAEIDQMHGWRSEWYRGEPAADRADMPAMDMKHLETMAPGPDYDVMFIDMMIAHHESAVQMSEEALTKASHPEVRALARRIIDAQQREIDQMRVWKAAAGSQEHDGHH